MSFGSEDRNRAHFMESCSSCLKDLEIFCNAKSFLRAPSNGNAIKVRSGWVPRPAEIRIQGVLFRLLRWQSEHFVRLELVRTAKKLLSMQHSHQNGTFNQELLQDIVEEPTAA